MPEVFRIAEKIDNRNDLTTIILNNKEYLSESTDGGSELIGYLQKNKIIKIKSTISLSYGLQTQYFYFDSSNLFYVKEIIEVFPYSDSLGTFNYTKLEINFIGDYIFNNNKLIDLESLGHNRFEDDKIDIEKTLIEEMGKSKLLIENKINQ